MGWEINESRPLSAALAVYPPLATSRTQQRFHRCNNVGIIGNLLCVFLAHKWIMYESWILMALLQALTGNGEEIESQIFLGSWGNPSIMCLDLTNWDELKMSQTKLSRVAAVYSRFYEFACFVCRICSFQERFVLDGSPSLSVTANGSKNWIADWKVCYSPVFPPWLYFRTWSGQGTF